MIAMASAATARSPADENAEENAEDAEFWRRAWRRSDVPGAFSHAEYFLEGLKRWPEARGRLPGSVKELKKALARDSGYQTSRALPRRFDRRPDRALNFGEKWEADLGDCGRRFLRLAGEGGGENARYFLLCVDIFSRKFFAEALENKTARTTKAALERIISRLTPPYAAPLTLETDRGGEFRGEFAEYCRERGIELKEARGENKARCAERGIRSLKKILTPLIESGVVDEWNDAVAQAERVANARVNRTLGVPPDKVPEDWERVRELHRAALDRPSWREYAARQRALRNGGRVRENGRNWKIGDLVRVPYPRQTLDKESDRQYKYQIFRIYGIVADRRPYLYKLEEWIGDEHPDTRRTMPVEKLKRYFYASELKPAYSADWHPVGRVLARRGRRVNVSFADYPTKFNSWIPAADMRRGGYQ